MARLVNRSKSVKLCLLRTWCAVNKLTKKTNKLFFNLKKPEIMKLDVQIDNDMISCNFKKLHAIYNTFMPPTIVGFMDKDTSMLKFGSYVLTANFKEGKYEATIVCFTTHKWVTFNFHPETNFNFFDVFLFENSLIQAHESLK